ncbi:DUF4147 domain-containing protein [Candidatus Nomurabacteria bacterium]|nr:DUF4147 domain-containing protein [Candidatus Nomurabacteria bacterium]
MQKNWIKNFDELATTSNRKLALTIAEAGLAAINTEIVVSNFIKLQNNVLSVAEKSFDLSKFKKIKVVGFGKASVDATVALEKILGSRIEKGAVIGLEKVATQYIETFSGAHPRPGKINIEAGEKIYEIIKDSSKEDLIIVLVSGGGSALLCFSESERAQNVTLYDNFLKSGKTITEINTVRKHLSILKGGGLAKIAYPATVIGLIFSDIPGDNFESVASGPTYRDKTIIADAEKIIAENNLGKFDLIETPKEDKYFENVHNFVLVSNKIAIEAMKKKAQELGFQVKIVSTELYDEIAEALQKIFKARNDDTVVLAAGEPKIEVQKKGGMGGRNLHLGLQAIKMKLIDDKSVFLSFASDGLDNSDAAGAVVDKNTIEKVERLNLNPADYLIRFDSYNFFQKSGDLIVTGPTGANVSDLMILLTKK